MMKSPHAIAVIKTLVIGLVFSTGILVGLSIRAKCDPLDTAFDRHVETETKKLCRFVQNCTLAGPYFGPQCERRLVCERKRI